MLCLCCALPSGIVFLLCNLLFFVVGLLPVCLVLIVLLRPLLTHVGFRAPELLVNTLGRTVGLAMGGSVGKGVILMRAKDIELPPNQH